MFGILGWYSRKPRPRYAVAGLFALLYGVFRFAVESVRLPDTQIGYLAFGWLTMGQVLSLPLIAIGLAWLWMSRPAPTLQPQPAARSPAPESTPARVGRGHPPPAPHTPKRPDKRLEGTQF